MTDPFTFTPTTSFPEIRWRKLLKPNQYKIGDRIVALGSTSGIATVAGDLGTVFAVDGSGVGVEWDRFVTPVKASAPAKRFWWTFQEEIRPATFWDHARQPLIKLWRFFVD